MWLKIYIAASILICTLVAYANFTGWIIMGGDSSSWGPKGRAGSTFYHK